MNANRMKRVTSHPGEVLAKDFLAPLGLSMNALSLKLRVPSNYVSLLVARKRNLTPAMALRLARFFGNSPQMWLSLQMNYDLTLAMKKHMKRIQAEVEPGGGQR